MRGACLVALVVLLGLTLHERVWAQVTTESPRGAVVVFAPADQPPPTFSSVAILLEQSGFAPPALNTQLLEGRALAAELASTGVVGKGTTLRCPQPEAPAMTAEELNHLLISVRRDILQTQHAQAELRLSSALSQLSCMEESLAREQLYRIFFLAGINAHYQGKDDLALQEFIRAVAVDPTREWDRAFPPSAFEIFHKALEAGDRGALIQFKVHLLEEDREVLFDGVPVGVEGVDSRAGLHVVQVEEEEGERVFRTYVFQSLSFETGGPWWLIDSGTLVGLESLVFSSQDPIVRQLSLEVLSAWAALRDLGWLLLVFRPEHLAEGPRFIYLDVKTSRVSRPPDEMVVSRSLVDDLTQPRPGQGGGKRERLRRTLHGWDAITTFQARQPFPTADRIVAVEIGGSRILTEPYSVRLAASAGLTADALAWGAFAGVRRTWESEPFGAFVDGGISVLRYTGDVGHLGLEVRPGAYYRLFPGSLSVLELHLALAFYPAKEAARGLGSLGLSYRRSW